MPLQAGKMAGERRFQVTRRKVVGGEQQHTAARHGSQGRGGGDRDGYTTRRCTQAEAALHLTFQDSDPEHVTSVRAQQIAGAER